MATLELSFAKGALDKAVHILPFQRKDRTIKPWDQTTRRLVQTDCDV